MGREETRMDTFHISATGLSFNYMPQYLAQALGYFAEQGLSVESYVPNPDECSYSI